MFKMHYLPYLKLTLKMKIFHFIVILPLLAGCGFHLRGSFSIPVSLQTLQILPNQPYDTFQRTLRQFLKSNNIKIVDYNTAEKTKVTTLSILTQAFSERTIAYGANGLANRAILELKISYQLINTQGKLIGTTMEVSVARELTVNPNAVLSTDNERSRLQTDLYRDAASQLVRQLSKIPANEL